MVGVVKDMLKFLKKVSFEVSRRICESTCVHVLVHRHTCLSILAGYCSTSHQADICVVCRADEDQGTSSRAGFGTTRSCCLGEEAAPCLGREKPGWLRGWARKVLLPQGPWCFDWSSANVPLSNLQLQQVPLRCVRCLCAVVPRCRPGSISRMPMTMLGSR